MFAFLSKDIPHIYLWTWTHKLNYAACKRQVYTTRTGYSDTVKLKIVHSC